MVHYFPEGTTEPQTFRLDFRDEDGALTADTLTGLSIDVALTDKAGDTVTGAGSASIVDATARTVRFTPTGDALTRAKSPYLVRFLFAVTGSPGDLFKVPNGKDPDVWHVVSP